MRAIEREGTERAVKERETSFLTSVVRIAVPVALQSMLQSSFSLVDQMMVGQLGSTDIAAVGIAGNFSFIWYTVADAIAAIAGILIAQYLGQRNLRAADRSLCVGALFSLLLGLVFFDAALFLPGPIARLYTADSGTIREAAVYLRIISWTYLPGTAAALLAVMLRCFDRSVQPLVASILAAVANTGLNYVLIFGRFGFPQLGVAGAAYASVLSTALNAALMLLFFLRLVRARGAAFRWEVHMERAELAQYLAILMPVLVTEFLWSLGQNVNTTIYGHIGTGALAARSLMSPVESLLFGALGGLAQAAGILIGKRLGERDYEAAYRESRLLMRYGLMWSLTLTVLVLLLRGAYVQIFAVEESVRASARALLVALAVLTPVKVQNMILGGGIIRSGGRTRYVMWIDLAGTWLLDVPIGLFAAFVLRLPVEWVYFLLSLEEVARWVVSLWLFRTRRWMETLEAAPQ